MTSTRKAPCGARAAARTMVPDPRHTHHTDHQTD
jgi:hypothetical protein